MNVNPPVPSDRTGVHDPDALWWPWLRTVLQINLFFACVSMFAVMVILRGVPSIVAQGKASGRFWLTPDLLAGVLTTLAMPAFHLIASIGCLKRRPAARVGMIVYCWVALGLALIEFGRIMYGSVEFWGWNEMTAHQILRFPDRIVLPLITLLFITRPPIRALFIPEAKAFEVIQ